MSHLFRLLAALAVLALVVGGGYWYFSAHHNNDPSTIRVSGNIEVIDAQREARDAETAAAVAAHGVRRAHLELLYAMGLFPQ